jgi:hypothetical protein
MLDTLDSQPRIISALTHPTSWENTDAPNKDTFHKQTSLIASAFLN